MQFKNIGTKQTKDVIPATKDALAKITECADIMENLEFGCAACATSDQENDGHRIIVDFPLCFDQFVGPGNCDLTDRGYNKNITEMDQMGLEEIGIAHGHGHFGPFHSGLDNKALKEVVVPSCFQNNREAIPPTDPKELISRVYSIVVNRARGMYAEINYLIETIDQEGKGHLKAQFKKETIVKPITDFPHTLDFSREGLVRELVTRVFFPQPKSIPASFKQYQQVHNSLRDIRADKKLNRFAEKMAQFVRSGQSAHASTVMQFIDRLDQQFAERLKFVYNLDNPAPHIRDLFAFCLASDECPEWVHAFVDESCGPAPKRTIFRRRETGSSAIDDSVIENFLDNITSEFQQELDTGFVDDLDLDLLIAEKEAATSLEPAQPTVVSGIAPHLSPIEALAAQNQDVGRVYGYAKLALLAAIPSASFADLEKVMSPEVEAVFAMPKGDIIRLCDAITSKNGRLDNLLSEQGHQGLPEIPVNPVSFDQLKDTLTRIINKERSSAHKSAEDAMFFKESLPTNWIRKYAAKAALYVSQLKQEIKTLSKYETLVPGIRETTNWLKQQEQGLHIYVLRFFGRFEEKLEDYETACTEHGPESAEAEKARSVIKEYVSAASNMPSKPYWYHRNKLQKALEEIEDEHE